MPESSEPQSTPDTPAIPDDPTIADDPTAPERVDGSATHPHHRIDWTVLRHDLTHPAKGQLIIALILCLFATVLVSQVRQRAHEDPFSQMRRADLVAMLDSLSTSSRQLDSQIADLRETRRQLESGADARKVAAEQARERLAQLEVLQGTVPVHGPGITLTISDPQQKVTSDMLLDAVEEMRDAGAEAMAVNGKVRVVANTWFATGADGLVVSGKPISRPIVLTVIGDPHSLEEGARFRGGLVSQVESDQVGASVTITRSQDLTISAVVSPAPMTHATPVR